MTPEFLLESLLRDEPAEKVLHTYDEALEELSSGAARVTPQATRAVAGRTLAAVVGLGHAGLPSAVALHRAGLSTVGIDTSASRLAEIRAASGDLHGVPQEDLQAWLADEGSALSDSLEAVRDAALVTICVPTTIDARHRPDPDALRRTCAAVVERARAGQTLVLASTVWVGATRELLVEPLAKRGLHVGEDVFVACAPLRSDLGVVGPQPAPPTRVVGAVTETCFRHVSELLEPVDGELHRVSSPEAAEMARLYESVFQTVNIALACQMADACRIGRLDPIEVTEAAATKPHGFMAHYPSAGVGGPGIGIDAHYLLAPLHERGCPATLAEEALRTVATRPRRVAAHAHELLLRSGLALREARVLIVGVTYKPGVADCTDAPAVEVISRLLAEGVQVDFHDPLVPALRVDGEVMHGIDPDPRRDASGFGPEDYELVVLIGKQPGHDYGWLRRCSQVLDCTYREPAAGRRRYLL